MKKIKINKIAIILVVFAFLSVLVTINQQNSYSIENENNVYTREELEDIVLSTALQFYYKKYYSDYDYGYLNYLKDFRWRNLNITPEDVSTANYYMTDCSAFAYLVYNSSLGYNAATEQISSNKQGYQIGSAVWSRNFYTNFVIQNSSESISAFQKGTSIFGVGWDTSYLEKMAREYWDNHIGGTGSEEGQYYYNDSESKSPFVFYYRYPQSYRTNPPETIINIEDNFDLISFLKPGDIIVTSRMRNSDGNQIGGHVFVYAGKTFATTVGLGNDILAFQSLDAGEGNYDIESVPIGLGYDPYSVALASEETLKKYFRYYNRTDQNTFSVAIIRPINSFRTSNGFEVPNMNSNAIARKELMFLKNEQYARKYFTYNDYVDNGNDKIDMNESKYNSFNNHDIIRYFLELTNQEGNTSYNNITITATIPEGADYVKCYPSASCNYDNTNEIVMWNNININDLNKKQYYFEVEINTEEDSVTFDGYNVEYNGYNLKLGSLTNDVNPTLTAINENQFESELENINNSNVTFSSPLEFIESLYQNALGIDLGFLSGTTTFSTGYKCTGSELSNKNDSIIKSALFKFDCEGVVGANVYATRTNDEEIDNYGNKNYYRTLTSDEEKIRAMLVPGMYGGQLLIGDDAENRAKYIRLPHDLEYGDIIITFDGLYSDQLKAYIYLGRSGTVATIASYDYDYYTAADGNTVVVENENQSRMLKIYDGTEVYDKYWTSEGDKGKTATRVLKEIYASDLFAVLRPTRLFGTTVKYELNNGDNTEKDFYVAYDKYRNLITPTREGYTFDGWYTDNNFTNKVENNTSLPGNIENRTLTLYAKWDEIPPNLVSIEMYSLPTKTSYVQGYENIDLTGGKIKANYDNDTNEIIDLTSEGVTVTGFDNTTTGIKTLTVNYEGFETTFEVEVVSKTVNGISIKTMPTKTSYILGLEELNLEGGVLTVTYNDSTTSEISLLNENVAVTGFDNTSAGTKTLTVSYQGFETTFEVTITKVLLGIPEVSIDTNGIVTWSNVEGASSYEVSFDNVSYTSGTSGNVTIPLTNTGLVTAYVKGVPDENHITSENSYGSASVNVYSLTITKDEGINTVSGTGNYVSGKAITITATLNEGYTFTGWLFNGDEPDNINSLTTTVTLTQNTSVGATSTVVIEEPVFHLPNMTIDAENNILNNIDSQTSLSELFNTTENNEIVEIYSKDGILLYSSDTTSNVYISTGQYVTYLNQNNERVTYKIVVPGDTDGNGKISYMDYVKVYNHIQKSKHPELTNKSLLVGEYLIAGDMSGDERINYMDYVKIYNKIKELKGSGI